MSRKKKKVYKDITLNELSNVDRPAQAPAKAVIIKRAKEEVPNNKVGAATANPDKSVDGKSTQKNGGNMPEITQADLDAAVKKAVDEMAVKLTKSESLAGMNDSQKEFYNKLDDAGKENFLKMSNEDKDKEVEKVKKSDDSFVADGQTIMKSVVGPEVFAIMKSQNDRIEKAERASLEAIEKSKDQFFQKKATEMFTNLPGTPETQGAVLKAIDGLPEDVQKNAIEMLKAGSTGMTTDTNVFKSYGDDGEVIIKKDDKEQNTLAILKAKYKKK